jgi:hypothetical protein
MAANPTPTINCLVCGSDQTRTFFHLDGTPVEGNLLWTDRQSARSVTRGDIHLAFCSQCGHVFNTRFDPALLVYTQQYENSLYFSPRFQAYAHELALGLVERHNLHNRSLVEIGSGKGDFLNQLCELGGNTGTGYDPSYDGTGSPFSRVRFVQGYFSDQFLDEPLDFLYARHTLEHIPQPRQFVDLFRRAAAKHPTMTAFIEVPNVRQTIAHMAIWDLIYEHVSYFSAPSLATLFNQAQFDVCHLEETYEGQFLTLEAAPSAQPVTSPADLALQIDQLAAAVEAFELGYQEKTAAWKNQLHDLSASGKKAVIWGAGTKGISFLNVLNVQDEIEYVVDINPRKRGKYITGSGQQIVPPEFLADYKPDVVVVMNPIYTAEITETLAGLGLHPELMVA